MSLADILTVLLTAGGLFFFIAGTVGLLRFPDVFSRLHALTKVDNLGLGLIVAGLVLQVESILSAAQLILIWLLVLGSSAASCNLLADYARHSPGENSTRGERDDF